MTRSMSLAALSAAVLLALPALAEEDSAPAEPPDLTRRIDFERSGEYYLGPTGAKGWMFVNQRLMTDEARQILVTDVAQGSAADGVLQPGDVILGVGDAHFPSDARKCLGWAIDEAEREASRGVLRLIRWRPVPNAPTRQGSEKIVEVHLPVMGAYSDTAPYDCPKTMKLLDRALQVLVERDDWSIFGIKALALLATGQPKYIRLVHDYLHEVKWARPDFRISVESGGLVAWGAGYRNLVLTEYYLATGDRYVLPAIREHAVKTAMGQSAGGVWGHGFAWTSRNDGRLHGRLGGYGAVNQAGLPCFLSLVLSKKCGIEHPEIDAAIQRSRRFFRQFVGHGSIGYGFHRPSLEIHCNGRNGMSGNGKNGIAALIFGLLDDRPAEQFFCMLTLSAHNTCEYGHSGNSWSYFWDPLGANCGGPEAAAAFHRQLRWYYALTRRPDGSFVNQPLGGYYGRGTLDATVAHVLMMTSPRRAIYLTGKGNGRRWWLDEQQVDEAIQASRWRFADTDDMSAGQLIDRLDNWSPIAREWIATALGKREGDFVPRLLELLQADKPEARAGACTALGYLGERAAGAVPAVARALQDDEPVVRIAASYALARMQQPSGKAVPDMLQAVLANREPGPMRPAQQALAYSLGYDPGKYAPLYFSGVLPNLAPQGNPLRGVDRKLLRESVAKLLRDPSARVRGCGAYALKFFTDEDVAALAQPIYDAIVMPAPNYAMFDDQPRQYGLDLLERLGVREGVELCWQTLEPNRWGQGARLSHRFQALRRYGAAARPLLPRLKELRWTVKSAESRQLLEQAIATIRADKTVRPLVSLHTLVDRRLAHDLASAQTDAQRVRRCRELVQAHPDDSFYQAAVLRRLVSLLGPQAMQDVLRCLGHPNGELRKTAVELGSQLPGDGLTRRWIDALSQAKGPRAADVLEILVARASRPADAHANARSEILAAARQRLDCADPVLRAAAMRAAATLGGQTELPRLVESLVTMPPDDAPARTAAEQALLAACRSADDRDGAADRLAAALADATAEAKPSLIRVIGQLDGARALDALVAVTREEDRNIGQAAFDALASSPDPRATDMLLAMIADGSQPRARNAAFTACLHRVVAGRVPPERKRSTLRKLLALADSGRNASATLAELAWTPSIDSLRLAQAYLDKNGLTESAAAAAVAIAKRLDMTDPEQEKAARAALERVLELSKNEDAILEAKALLGR